LAEIMIEIYAAESALLRSEKLLLTFGDASSRMQATMSRIYLAQAVEKINIAGKEAIAAFVSGDEQKVILMGLKRFTKTDLINTKAMRREIAAIVLAEEKYPFFIQ